MIKPAWTSGSRGVPGGKGYTSYAYANPIRKVLATVLMTRDELRAEELDYDTESSDTDTETDTDAAAGGWQVAKLGYTVDVVDVVERYLFTPLLPVIYVVVRTAKRLQSGRLDAYMAYMLIALVRVISTVTVLATT